mgnify:CR=1 FL=1
MIRILTDSASDILPAEAEQLGVTVIPLNVTLEDGTVLRDGIDKTPSEYYALLKECHKLPTTSQPSPELFERFYQDAAAAGDEVLGIFLSHELSGTYQCAKLAADLANVDNVLFVDSTNVCLGEGLLVRMAAHLRDEGKSAVQIAATLEHAKEHLHLVAAIDDLKYLRKGGRISGASALVGSLLQIKPILRGNEEGKIVLFDKARGKLRAIERLVSIYKERAIDLDDLIGISHGDCPGEALRLETKLREAGHRGPILLVPHEPVTGAHVGPGMLSLYFHAVGK